MSTNKLEPLCPIDYNSEDGVAPVNRVPKTIILVETNTIFGHNIAKFSTVQSALNWVNICIQNGVECKVIPA